MKFHSILFPLSSLPYISKPYPTYNLGIKNIITDANKGIISLWNLLRKKMKKLYFSIL